MNKPRLTIIRKIGDEIHENEKALEWKKIWQIADILRQ